MSSTFGIDVSKRTLDCAYRRDADQVKAKRKRFMNRSEDFDSLLAWSESLADRNCQDTT